ncbi:hypothetical protein GCM10022206_85100 [Streptomyces chiangmaiensis]
MQFLPVSHGTKRGIRRTILVNALAMTFALIGGFTVLSLEAVGKPLPGSLGVIIVLSSLILMFFNSAVLMPVIVLFNRPRFLVAPPYRHERGAVALRRRRREIAQLRGVRDDFWAFLSFSVRRS